MNRTVPGLPFSRKRTCSTYWAASSLVTPQKHEFLYSRVLQHRRSLLEQALFLWLHWINSQQWKWNATVFQLSWLFCFYGKQQLHAMNLKSTNCWKLGPIINRQLVFFVFVFVCLFVIFYEQFWLDFQELHVFMNEWISTRYPFVSRVSKTWQLCTFMQIWRSRAWRFLLFYSQINISSACIC